MNKLKKGFTLIELLIVIALIGVLAVALLSTINPVEQTRKAKDTSRKNAAVEILSAVERFQVSFGCYPWDYAAGACGAATTQSRIALTTADLVTDLTTTSNEIKAEFFTRAVVKATGTNNINLTVAAANQVVHVCFVPESKTFLGQVNKTIGGGTGTPKTHICVPE